MAGKPAKLSELTPATIEYFHKLADYDTLRLVLADKLALVEGACTRSTGVMHPASCWAGSSPSSSARRATR